MAGGVVPLLVVVAACLLGLVVAFQVTLAAGAPWGAFAYGGRVVQDDGRLPIRYRWSSAAAAVLLAGAAWLVLAAGGVVDRGPVPAAALEPGAWVLAGFFTLNTVGNLAGRHPVERFGAGALTAVLAVLCGVVAVLR